jgi:hypothetical protein
LNGSPTTTKPLFRLAPILSPVWNDVVYGIFVNSANMSGWEKVCIKGDERPDATVTAVWCASLDEAEAISRRCGDRST